MLGSNMPCTPDAVQVLRKANILVAPAMAAGAGGVRCLLNISCVNYTYILHQPKQTLIGRGVKFRTFNSKFVFTSPSIMTVQNLSSIIKSFEVKLVL
jgi:hypothetical protein